MEYLSYEALLIIELFRLFAKVLLALRPFAMCLKMLKFGSSADEYFLNGYNVTYFIFSDNTDINILNVPCFM